MDPSPTEHRGVFVSRETERISHQQLGRNQGSPEGGLPSAAGPHSLHLSLTPMAPGDTKRGWCGGQAAKNPCLPHLPGAADVLLMEEGAFNNLGGGHRGKVSGVEQKEHIANPLAFSWAKAHALRRHRPWLRSGPALPWRRPRGSPLARGP